MAIDAGTETLEGQIGAPPTPKGGDRPDLPLTNEPPRVPMVELDIKHTLKRYQRCWDRDWENTNNAYLDLDFAAGDQWPHQLRVSRMDDSRPVLTFNRCGQFIRQVTGDMKQMRPAIKVVAANDGTDEKIAEIRSGLMRAIEQSSDAEFIYGQAADSQVTCGIGHWEICGEYADDSTYKQELRIRTVDDQVSVLWDPDARHPTRRDAIFCFVLVDMSKEAYEAAYPGYALDDLWVASMGGSALETMPHARGDKVRLARYWYKIKTKTTLISFPNGRLENLDGLDPEDVQRMLMMGGKLIERPGYKIQHRMMNGKQFLEEPQDWPGRYIPIVPVIGEEHKIGTRVVRHGIIRFAIDPQRAYNYARSTQTEFVGLQPKAPYIATEENIKDYENQWATANNKNWPFLLYKPDPRNGNVPPQRQMPPGGAPGVGECIQMAAEDMQAVIGIYNASLGAQSNETSGVAIRRRQTEGDTGTYLYVKNFSLSIAHTARILNDLIPHFYDSERMVRVLGADGSEQMIRINQQSPIAFDGVPLWVLNDLTTGEFDIKFDMGPSYQTKREEAREGMTEFIQAFPQAAPLMGDLIAKAQDWPNADDVADRLHTLLPPQIQMQIAQKTGDQSKMPPPPQPSPQDQAEMAKADAEKHKADAETVRAQMHVQQAQFDGQKMQLQLRQQELANVKAEFEVLEKQIGLAERGTSDQMHDRLGKIEKSVRLLAEHATEVIANPPAPPDIGQMPPPSAQPQQQSAQPGAP